MADHPFTLEPALAERLSDHLDRESKIARVLDDLGPLDGRDVAVVGSSPRWERELAALGARVRVVPSAAETGLPDGSVDAVVSLWSAFPGPVPAEIAEAERILRPGGRILVLHDYGRDDVSRLRPTDLPEYGAWSRRNGPFLAGGWRIRVVHAWWTFESTDEARDLLTTAFGPAGEEAAATLRRPRMSYNVAIYHRTKESATS